MRLLSRKGLEEAALTEFELDIPPTSRLPSAAFPSPMPHSFKKWRLATWMADGSVLMKLSCGVNVLIDSDVESDLIKDVFLKIWITLPLAGGRTKSPGRVSS